MTSKIVMKNSPIHGNGIYTAIDLDIDETIIEYKGLLRTHTEADFLYEGQSESGHTFLFTLNEEYIIDGNVGGNIAKWINHSCDPNCRAYLLEDLKGNLRKDRIFIEALRSICAGEELTYDYGIVLQERHTPRLKKIWQCRCGSRNCTGTLLKSKSKKKYVLPSV